VGPKREVEFGLALASFVGPKREAVFGSALASSVGPKREVEFCSALARSVGPKRDASVFWPWRALWAQRERESVFGLWCVDREDSNRERSSFL